MRGKKVKFGKKLKIKKLLYSKFTEKKIRSPETRTVEETLKTK